MKPTPYTSKAMLVFGRASNFAYFPFGLVGPIFFKIFNLRLLAAARGLRGISGASNPGVSRKEYARPDSGAWTNFSSFRPR
ncbi:MAG: hypothetical protein ACYDDF_13685, partial [Thermoplasmatota archaeon]